MTLIPGTKLGPYEILAPIGAGGMGEVYRAQDPRLGREVAVKVLPESFASDRERLRRFEEESRAAGVLNHPNVTAVYDVGEQDGIPYVVQELLEGETLRARLAAGALAPARAIAIAAQAAHGLAAAHRKGILHRDLKPENLFITSDGRAKLLDFGIAKASFPSSSIDGTAAPTLGGTEPGLVLGTPGYMSPEQARGERLDARSDIFSLGCVLYEMLSGRRAFPGATAAEAMVSVFRDEPPDLPASIASPLERLVRRCLEKNREERFQSARDLAFALDTADTPAGERRPATGPAPSRPGRSVAVLLFKDLAGDPGNAHLGLGLADATITELAGVRSLVVRPTAAILRYRDRPADPQEAGRELGVEAVVDGSFQRAGSKLRVTVQLIDTADGSSLWGAKIDTSLDDLFRMQDEVSRKISEALAVELSPSDALRPARQGTKSGAAYELYLKGRLHLSFDTTLPEVNAAIECFESALADDPEFVLAQLGLGDAYARMDFSIDPEGGWYARAESMCRKALSTAPDLPEGRYLRGRLLWHPRSGWDGAGAMREFAAAIAGRPSLGEAHHFLGQLLNHLGLLDEAVHSFDRALAIDPSDHYAGIHRALARYLQCRFEEALAALEPQCEAKPTPWGFYQVALCQLHLGRRADAAVTLEALSRRFPDNVLLFSLRGLSNAIDGDSAAARGQIELVIRNRKLFGHFHHAQYDVACIELLLGRQVEAIERLEDAVRNGFQCLPFFDQDPWLAPIKGEPGFLALLERLRTEQDGHRRLYEQLAAAVG